MLLVEGLVVDWTAGVTRLLKGLTIVWTAGVTRLLEGMVLVWTAPVTRLLEDLIVCRLLRTVLSWRLAEPTAPAGCAGITTSQSSLLQSDQSSLKCKTITLRCFTKLNRIKTYRLLLPKRGDGGAQLCNCPNENITGIYKKNCRTNIRPKYFANLTVATLSEILILYR